MPASSAPAAIHREKEESGRSYASPIEKGIRAFAAVLLLLLFSALPARAQLSTKLPTPQAADHGNGAASSEVAGGAFEREGPAMPAPASSFGTPTAFGADWRDVFAGAGVQRGIRYARDFTDGAAFGGFGLGDAREWVGAELTLAVYDLLGETFRDGSLGLKLHRRLPGGVAAAAGIENLFIFGETDGGRSAYGVVSKAFDVRGPEAWWLPSVTASLGVGDGRFNSVENVRAGENRAGLFGSLGVRVVQPVSLLASWTGQDLNLGLSVVPLRRVPLVVTPALLDVTGHAGDRARFALGVGAGFTIDRF